MNTQKYCSREIILWAHKRQIRYIAQEDAIMPEILNEIRSSKENILNELTTTTAAFIITINGQQATHAENYPSALRAYNAINQHTPASDSMTTIKLMNAESKLLRASYFQPQKE